MKYFYQKTKANWQKFSLAEQMANIGAEIGRAINWRKKREEKLWQNAFFRALELIDFTVTDPKNLIRLKELLRLREILVDYFFGANIYQTTEEWINKYFYFFNFKARGEKF